jgi:hypothetical protein
MIVVVMMLDCDHHHHDDIDADHGDDCDSDCGGRMCDSDCESSISDTSSTKYCDSESATVKLLQRRRIVPLSGCIIVLSQPSVPSCTFQQLTEELYLAAMD